MTTQYPPYSAECEKPADDEKQAIEKIIELRQHAGLWSGHRRKGVFCSRSQLYRKRVRQPLV